MLKTYKNLFFSFVGILYFSLYFGFEKIDVGAYFLEKYKYGEYIFSYFSAIIAFILVIGVIGLFNSLLKFLLTNNLSNKKNLLFFVEIFYSFLGVTKYFLGLYAFVYFAIFPDFFKVYLQKFYFISIILIFIFYLTKFINKFFEKDLQNKSKLKGQSKTLFPFVNKIIVVFIWIVGIITIFDNLGYNIAALLAGAGIGGLAIAFAAQKSISNIFGAINILLNKPFNIGDYVSINGVTGTVKDIGLSYLTITDKLGHQVMIPNEVIISNNVENFSIRENRRTDFSIGVAFGTSLEKMQEGVKIIESILEEEKELGLVGNYRVNFDMFGEFSLNIQATYFSLINDSIDDYVKQKEKINLEIKNRFANAVIEMAFPTRELIIKKES
ncbi:MAG: mechanosensitive ion channel family protein [Candidatus Gracilibacteria bacterium]|nr:mechanosensitive ion channel family protein [Candidatus Gracilibacteria bacterium]